MKGLASGLAGSAALPLFMKRFEVSIERFQSYTVAIMTPWSLKPIFGLVSDTYPIRGVSKRYYMLAASVVGAACFVGLALLTGCEDSTVHAAVFLLFGISLQAAIVDLLAEGKYAERMRESPESGGALPSFVWGSLFAGSIVAAAIAGPLADAGQLRAIFALGVPFSAYVSVPLLIGWFPEKTVLLKGCEKLRQNNGQNTRMAALAVIMALSSVGLTGITLAAFSPKLKLCLATGISLSLCIVSRWSLPRRIFLCNLYMFLASLLHVSLVGALDYFYTAPPICLKNGPNFSMTFFVTWSQIAGSVASLFAVALFQGCLQNWALRSLFWISTVVRCLAAGVDLIIVNRLNISVGIPDKIAYMLGNNVAASVAAQLDLMPAVVLTSKLCPPGMESTIYAILAGFQNFGGSVSAAIGASLTSEFGVKADFETGDCEFQNLSLLIVLSHIVLPMLTVPLTFILIPDVGLKDKLDAE